MSLPSHPLVIRRPLLEAARDAAEIVAAAREQAAQERADQRRSGFQEGAAAGMEAAARTVRDIEAEIGAYWAAREAELLDTALAIAHRVIALQSPGEILRGLARAALAEHRHDTRLVLRVDPSSLATLQSALREGPDLSGVEIRADASLPSGSIMLEHETGQTEIGLVGQFRAMVRQGAP